MRDERSGRISLPDVTLSLLAIGMLLSLLLPLLQQRGLGPSRRSTCQNNMRQCGLALIMVQERQRQYPGYANVAGAKRASWVVMILPQIERNDLYQNWQREGYLPGYHEKDSVRAKYQL